MKTSIENFLSLFDLLYFILQIVSFFGVKSLFAIIFHLNIISNTSGHLAILAIRDGNSEIRVHTFWPYKWLKFRHNILYIYIKIIIHPLADWSRPISIKIHNVSTYNFEVVSSIFRNVTFKILMWPSQISDDF